MGVIPELFGEKSPRESGSALHMLKFCTYSLCFHLILYCSSVPKGYAQGSYFAFRCICVMIKTGLFYPNTLGLFSQTLEQSVIKQHFSHASSESTEKIWYYKHNTITKQYAYSMVYTVRMSRPAFAQNPLKIGFHSWYRTWWRQQMETFSRVTGHLCVEFTGDRWIPRKKASDVELWCFLWCLPE